MLFRSSLPYLLPVSLHYDLMKNVLDLKSQCCQGQLSSFTMATISSPAISHALLPMTTKADKLLLGTEPVARHNNASRTLKPGHQMFVAPYSTALCVASWLAACLLAFLLSFCHSFNALTYFFYMFRLFNLSSLI